jgi:hypothetical protein
MSAQRRYSIEALTELLDGAQLTRVRLLWMRLASFRQASPSTHRCAGLVFLSAGSLTLGDIFTVRLKPFMRDQLMASASDFNSNVGLWCVRRSRCQQLRNIKAQDLCANAVSGSGSAIRC